jgi:ribosomal protein L25 (general stress protein Ctc)
MAMLHVMRQGKELSTQPQEMQRQGLVSILLVDKTNSNHRMVASFTEIKRAIKEAEGVGKFDLKVDGEKGTRQVIVKAVERDTLDRTRFRLTLAEIKEGDTLRIDVPVTYHGVPPKMTKEVVIERPCKYLRVRGKAGELPTKIDVDLATLDTGHTKILAGEVDLPSGVELLTPEETTLFCMKKVSSDRAPSAKPS